MSFVYTFTGGVKGVIWADVLQMLVYIGGAGLAIWVLLGKMPETFSWVSLGDKTEVFNLDFGFCNFCLVCFTH